MPQARFPEDARMSGSQSPPSHLPISDEEERQAVENQLSEDSLDAKITEPSKLIDQKRKRRRGVERNEGK